MASTSQINEADTTFAAMVWPTGARETRREIRGWARSAALVAIGACLLTIAAKVQVPGPVPMTLQTLAVLALGATLGFRHAVGAVLLYVAEGAMGLPVFANTPPMVPGLAYLMGPTGGFLFGFAVAAGLVGLAADRGLMSRPVRFGLVLAAASLTMLACGFVWLATAAQVGTMTGLGFARAFQVGIQPFLLGEAIKVGLAALALPLIFQTLARVLRR